MFLKQAYGKGAVTAIFSLLMLFSMIINQSLVARTFGSYTLQLFEMKSLGEWGVPLLGALLLIIAFIINIISNKYIERLSIVMAFVKTIGLLLLALGGLWAADIELFSIFGSSESTSGSKQYGVDVASFIGAIALSILAFKGFTTITNSGDEIVNPKKNIGKAIVLSITICLVIYLLVAFAVSGNLSISAIIKAKDYALAEASKPAFGQWGLTITVFFAIIATISGVIASIFAVSRMLTMLTKMKLVPHSHFGMPGDIQKHSVVYIVAIALLLTIFFDLSRIASIGAIFYLLMDIAVHYGALTKLRSKVELSKAMLIIAIILDLLVLTFFVFVKWEQDPFVIWSSLISLLLIISMEMFYLRNVESN